MVLDCEAEGEAIMSCAFDHVFDEQSNQEDVYELTSEALVLDALEGYNWYPKLTLLNVPTIFSTIFAYGQTGAGKSHTIVGNLLEGAEDEVFFLQMLLISAVKSLARHYPTSGRNAFRAN